MKRQSTTAKITHATSKRIAESCRKGEGVIVRHRGIEYGVLYVVRTASGFIAHTLEGTTLALSGCTIRKATLPHLPAYVYEIVQRGRESWELLENGSTLGRFFAERAAKRFRDDWVRNGRRNEFYNMVGN